MARWLLTMNDYVGDELRLTHDLMALTLGVRRAGVSVAANTFRNSGAIDYRRGYIQVVDRKGLEAILASVIRLQKRSTISCMLICPSRHHLLLSQLRRVEARSAEIKF